MGTKTDEEIAREAFKQELLHTSNWGLRRLATGPKGAGVEIATMKTAEETGPEAVVEIILEKYDAGWRPGGATLNPQSKPSTNPAGKRTTKKKESKKEAGPKKKKEAEPVDDNPVASAWDEEGSDGLPADLDLDAEEEEEDEPIVEPEPEPEPKPETPKRQRRRVSPKTAPAGEVSALEEKVDRVLDTLMKMAAMFSKIEKTLSGIDKTVNDLKFHIIESKETTVTALHVLFKKGLPTKGFGKIKERATSIAKEACGLDD